ncbi:M23 family metallopeptidase [Winogradskyella ursingii]|uniref:M23 family metallopeptidase n=1 Tax=Winogradskyella ursingii TaxID=2686079 RepID=UPI0015C718FF|nr:M23 family metallopeptidase [Winogradskyella ursingii]
MKSHFRFVLVFIVLASCKQVQKVSDAITNPSAREIFERTFENNDTLVKRYEFLYSNAKKNRLKLELPSVLSAKSDSLDFRVLSYTIELQRGERLKIESDIIADSLQLAIDVFEFETDSIMSEKPLLTNEPESNKIDFDVIKTGKYKVVILPEFSKTINFSIKFYTEPTLAFPVSGKNNRAVQSFWGAPRGGGTRSHKGIDIFAKRGTPVVAATEGFISNTGNRGLGGKQVWLRDGLFGQSLYYAHLDSIVVASGKRVKIGDTLGFVGNTGNAKTTAPHLHFGIYTRGGAVDPYPFVKHTEVPGFEKLDVINEGVTRLKNNELRLGAGVNNEKIQDLNDKTSVIVIAKNNRWYHLKVNDSLQGFMHESLVKPIK